MNTVWSFFTKHAQFGFVVLFVLLVLGALSVSATPKESTPEVDVPVVIISTVYPGASAEEVESLITNELERPLKAKLKDVKTISSTSSEGVSVISIEFTASADLDQSLADTKDEVDLVRPTLPDDANDPFVRRVSFADEPVVTATLSANIPSELLYRLAEDTENALEGVPGVGSVTVSGVPDKQTFVIVRPEVLTRYNLTAQDVSRALAAANVTLPAGSIVRDGATYTVRVNGELKNADDVGGVLIGNPGGTPVFVRDVATIVEGRAPLSSMSRTSVNGAPVESSVSFDVFKAEGTNITDVSSRVLTTLDELQKPGGTLEGVQVLVMFDRGDLLVQDLSVLVESGIETMVLVLLVLVLTVGVREAIISAISVPLSFVVAFIGIYYSGNTINFVSLFALILSIGILVDSSIVIIDAINRQLLEMDHPVDETPSQRIRVKVRAALNAIADFHAPLTSGTLTTVAVFVPLFLVSGITGEFIASIPFTTLFVLTASLVVALGFVPLIASRFLKRGHTQSVLDTWRTRIVDSMRTSYRTYLQRVLTERSLQHTFVITLVVLFVFSLSLPAIGAVRTVFFESSDADYIFAEVEMPPGTRLEQTSAQTKQVEELLYGIPEIESFVTTVGSTSQFTGGGVGGSTSAEKYANIFISLRKDRARTSAEIIEQERSKFESINTAIVRFSELEDGPPSSAPVGVTLTSDSLNDLDTAARIMTQALRETPGTSDITNSITEPPVEYVIAIDRARAAAAGILPSSIALSVRTALYGSTATELREPDKNVDVVVQTAVGTSTNARELTEGSIESVQTIPITSTTGQLVPLSSVASVQVQAGRESITHKNGDRIATVSSRLAEGGNAVVITQELQNKLPTLGLPASVHVSFGGESEDVDQSFRDMFVALFLGLVGMFGILLLEFDSIRHAGYVLLTVPLALIGVFMGLMITGSPLSFPSMMGFIALAGIVVNNAIILIDVFNTERAKLTEEQETPEMLQHIVLEGSVSRLRPVLLTAVTTVIGTLPLLWAAELWVPLVYAMVFGLIFATVITLVFIPILYLRYPGSVTRL